MSCFINHTNHPSSQWNEDQKKAAARYGEILDLPFPSIPPNASAEEVSAMAEDMFHRMLRLRPCVVLCQGEFTYSYALIRLLRKEGISVVAACSERDVTEWNEGETSQKSVRFRFIQFRQYL